MNRGNRRDPVTRNRRHGIVWEMRKHGIPVAVLGNGYEIGGIAGMQFIVGNRDGYRLDGTRTASPEVALERMAAANPRSLPVLLRHVKGMPFSDTVVSMRLADAGPLLAGLIDADPLRYIKKED